MSNSEMWNSLFFLTIAYLAVMPISLVFAYKFDKHAMNATKITAISLAVAFTLSYLISTAFLFQAASTVSAAAWFCVSVGFLAVLCGTATPLLLPRNKHGIPTVITIEN